MKKISITFCFALTLFNAGYCQKDSVHSLFKGTPHIKIPIRFSYFQWDFGYTCYFFNNDYINGYSADLFGMVFNDDLDLAVGIDRASLNARGAAPQGVVSYSGLYIKAEPLLLPYNLFNFSMPLKFAYSNIAVSNGANTGGYGGYGGGGRHRGGGFGGGGFGTPGNSFFSFTPGADVFINLFRFLSLGTGINYRFAFTTPGNYPKDDYNNFSFSILARIKIDSRKNEVKKQTEYYTPHQQR